MGLQYYEDLIQKIPRSEAEELSKQVKAVALPNSHVETCGSYRRGRAQCGDVDVLITPPPGLTDYEGILDTVIKRLKKSGFVKEQLGAYRLAGTGSATFMGVCCLGGKGSVNRRLDIKVYPREQYGYALLYFTGSAQFNRNMRTQALKYGFSLSDAGLKKMHAVKTGGEIEATIYKSLNELLKQKDTLVTEQMIMKAFGMKFHKPNERDV